MTQEKLNYYTKEIMKIFREGETHTLKDLQDIIIEISKEE